MPTKVNVREARSNLSELLELVATGEEVVKAKAGEPVAKLVPIAPRRRRTPGGGEGVVIHDDFFAPLPNDYL